MGERFPALEALAGAPNARAREGTIRNRERFQEQNFREKVQCFSQHHNYTACFVFAISFREDAPFFVQGMQVTKTDTVTAYLAVMECAYSLPLQSPPSGWWAPPCVTCL